VRLLFWILCPTSLFASLITDFSQIPNPQLVSNFVQPGGFVYTTGPTEVGNGTYSVTFTSTLPLDPFNQGSVLGGIFYDLGNNGSWGSDTNFAGLNFDDLGNDPYTMRFTLQTAVSAVGAFMNYRIPTDQDIFFGVSYGPVMIRALDSIGNTLEQYRIDDGTNDIITPGASDAGAWRGILRNSPDIAAIEFSNAGVILRDITIGQQPAPPESTPEPGLFGVTGLAIVLFCLYRRSFTA
jgi:hypothetical protein